MSLPVIFDSRHSPVHTRDVWRRRSSNDKETIVFQDETGATVAKFVGGSWYGATDQGLGFASSLTNENPTPKQFFIYDTSGSPFMALHDYIAAVDKWRSYESGEFVFIVNPTISNAAPKLIFTDTTASAKGLTIAVDANKADLREAAGASGSLLLLDLANNRVGIGTASPINLLNVEKSSYSSNLAVISNGLTGTPPAYPSSWLPTLVAHVSETANARPLWFGFSNGATWDGWVTIGAGGSFSDIVFDMGAGASAYTALQLKNSITSLYIGGGTDGSFSNVSFQNTGNVGVGLGATAPSNKLHVYSTTSADGLSIDGTTHPAIVMRNSGTIKGYAPALATGAGAFFSDASTNDLIFRTEANKILFGIAGGSAVLSVSSKVGIGTASPSVLEHIYLSDAVTNAATAIQYIEHTSSGTPAAGFGVTQSVLLKSSTTAGQSALDVATAWVVATHASRTARAVFSIYDTAAREALRLEASGSAAMLSFYGGAAVVRGAALTTQLTTITFTAPGTPDYAIQDFAQNGGAGIWGFADHDEANSVLKVIANLQTRVAELEARLGSATGVNLFA